MNMRLLGAFIAVSTCAAVIQAAEPNITAEALRASIAKALPLLETGSARSADERQCFTCHSQALPVIVFQEAIDYGFQVNQANIDRQVKHTHEHLKRGTENYRQARGQGGGVLTAGYALLTLEAARWPDDETTSAVAHYLLEHQSNLHHWRQRGTRPPTSGSDFTATYVALRSLAFFGTPEQRDSIAQRRVAVAKWLNEQKPEDTEDHVFRLLSLPYVQASRPTIDAATAELIQLQQSDGGWGQTTTMSSDAYATGTVINAVLRAGQVEATHPAIQRGAAYLLSTQLDDGTWHVATRAKPVQDYFESGFPHDVDQFISISATAWSTLALLKMLPKSRE